MKELKKLALFYTIVSLSVLIVAIVYSSLSAALFAAFFGLVTISIVYEYKRKQDIYKK